MSNSAKAGKRKPRFKRQNHGLKARLKQKWRKPRGLQSKLRLKKAGHGVSISIGWKAPKSQRGKTPDGLFPVVVTSKPQLSALDKKTQGALIPATLGFKKKSMIIEECLKLGLKVLNFSEPSKYIEAKKKVLEEKRHKKEKKPKKKTIEEKVQKVGKEEDTKEKEKREKDKVLTKRQ